MQILDGCDLLGSHARSHWNIGLYWCIATDTYMILRLDLTPMCKKIHVELLVDNALLMAKIKNCKL